MREITDHQIAEINRTFQDLFDDPDWDISVGDPLLNSGLLPVDSEHPTGFCVLSTFQERYIINAMMEDDQWDVKVYDNEREEFCANFNLPNLNAVLGFAIGYFKTEKKYG